MSSFSIHHSSERGEADYGWLKAKYSFSFSQYYNPNKVNFGVLRVLNNDIIAGGMGFGTHPHDNMEIITIPLSGALAHQDSLGNGTTINAGDIQVMSAGTGIKHSEFNASETEPCELFQIWLFPNQKNVAPRYDQVTYKDFYQKNVFNEILSPEKKPNTVWIYQNAWFNLATFDKQFASTYQLNDQENGVYLMIISGQWEINSQTLKDRDAIAISNTNKINIKSLSENAQLLIMEFPLEVQ